MKKAGIIITSIGALATLLVIRTTFKSHSWANPITGIGPFLPALAFLSVAVGLLMLVAGWVHPKQAALSFVFLAITVLCFVVACSAALFPALSKVVSLAPEPIGILSLLIFAVVHRKQ